MMPRNIGESASVHCHCCNSGQTPSYLSVNMLVLDAPRSYNPLMLSPFVASISQTVSCCHVTYDAMCISREDANVRKYLVLLIRSQVSWHWTGFYLLARVTHVTEYLLGQSRCLVCHQQEPHPHVYSSIPGAH